MQRVLRPQSPVKPLSHSILIDFCAAIRARGRRILFAPEVEIVHLRGRSASSAPAATQAAYRRSQMAFYEKHHPAWAPFLRFYLRIRGELPARP